MKLNKIIKTIIISCGIISLISCSALRHGNRAGVDDANTMEGGAQASGLGDGQGFGGMSPEELLAKRTYYFEFDRSEIHDEDRAAISANADYIMAHPHARVLLEGNTDPRGSREYNVALGERRANAVANILRSRGVNPEQIRVISYGAERLAVPGHTEPDYQQDRRVVLVYLQR